jgi:hypothetical protein
MWYIVIVIIALIFYLLGMDENAAKPTKKAVSFDSNVTERVISKGGRIRDGLVPINDATTSKND